MIDFYWLKSFTEIIQLFIVVLFLIYLKVKYGKKTVVIYWLSAFLFFKALEDFYGIINYTDWIKEILTWDILRFYFLIMGPLELCMLGSFYLFSEVLNRNRQQRHSFIFFLPAVFLLTSNILSFLVFEISLSWTFLLVRLLFIVALTFLLIRGISHRIRLLSISILTWNILWFAEVFLHEDLHIISEDTSWIIFVLAEAIFTVGIAYFLVQVIADPKLLKHENINELIPESLKREIEEKLNKAMHEEKLFMHQELTLSKLAEQLNTQSSDLTLYLNRILKVNFNKYIGALRIEESIRLLKNNDNLSIEQVMHQVGFNSKSVFNTAFKDKTGMTPSAFRNSVRSQTN